MKLKNSLIVNSNLPENYKIPGISRGIKSYNELKLNITRKDGGLDGRYNNIIDLLDNIAEIKDCDPVLYIHHIYYSIEQGVSADNLLKEFQKLGFKNYTSKESIYALLKNIFNWDLLERYTNTRESTKKQIITNPNHINNRRKDLEKKEIEKLYKKIKKSVDGLLLNELKYKKTLNQKIIYILFSLEYIKEENDFELAKFIEKYQDRGIGFLKTAQILKGLIIKIKPNLESEIDEQNLKKRLIERYKKHYPDN